VASFRRFSLLFIIVSDALATLALAGTCTRAHHIVQQIDRAVWQLAACPFSRVDITMWAVSRFFLYPH
jgi:hypothetical protein